MGSNPGILSKIHKNYLRGLGSCSKAGDGAVHIQAIGWNYPSGSPRRFLHHRYVDCYNWVGTAISNEMIF